MLPELAADAEPRRDLQRYIRMDFSYFRYMAEVPGMYSPELRKDLAEVQSGLLPLLAVLPLFQRHRKYFQAFPERKSFCFREWMYGQSCCKDRA